MPNNDNNKTTSHYLLSLKKYIGYILELVQTTCGNFICKIINSRPRPVLASQYEFMKNKLMK